MVITTDPRDIAHIFRDFVHFEQRKRTEIPFLEEQLECFKKPLVLDACLGTGVTSIGLLQKRYAVRSNEIDTAFCAVATEEAATHGVSLDLLCYDWRDLGHGFPQTFDALLCLGNSITLIHDKEERVKVLGSFYDVLKLGGKCIIDQRNYPALFLADTSGFRYFWSGNIVYCGKQHVVAHPVTITPDIVRMKYTHRLSGKFFHYDMYPFKKGELEEELKQAGFSSVKTVGDYQQEFDPTKVEFLTHICKK